MKEKKQKTVVILFTVLFCMFVFRTIVFAGRVINESISYIDNGKKTFLPYIDPCRKNNYKNAEEVYFYNYLNIGKECKSI